MPNKLVEQRLKKLEKGKKAVREAISSLSNVFTKSCWVSFFSCKVSSDGLTEHNSVQGKTGDCVQRCIFDNPFPN
jgi:hypothetical protein